MSDMMARANRGTVGYCHNSSAGMFLLTVHRECVPLTPVCPGVEQLGAISMY